MDAEIFEVFREEAEEVAEELADALARWRAQPTDEDALVVVRRSFHTLKGSGRMAGAERPGEFAWEMENLLNRALEGAIPVTEGLVALTEAGRAHFYHLLAAFQDLEDVDEAFHQRMLDRIAEAARGEPAVPPEERPAAAEQAEVPAAEPEAPAFAVDPALFNIFRQEAEGHLGDVAEAVHGARDRQRALKPDEGLVRAVHTLKGSARTAQVEPVARIGAALEALLRLRQQAHQHLESEEMALVEQSVDCLEQLLETLPETGPATRSADEIASRLETAAEAAEAAAAREGEGSPAALVRAFLEEANEIWERLDPRVQGWEKTSPVRDALQAAERDLHTLKGGARMAEVTPVVDVAHALESVLERLSTASAAEAGELLGVFRSGFDHLGELLEQIEAGRLPEADSAVLGRLQSAAEAGAGGTTATPEEAEAPAASQVEDAEEPRAPGTAEPEAMPVDAILESFLEEAEEIVPRVDAALAEWSSGAPDSDSLRAVERDVHTLKGGARMAEVAPVADLAHAMESLLSRLAEGAIEPDSGRLDRLQAGFDQLSEMLDTLGGGERPGPADSLVADLEAAARPEVAPEPAAAETEAQPPTEPPAEAMPVDAILESFLEEAEEIVPRVDAALAEWSSGAPDSDSLRAVERDVHTLKGGARMAEVAPVADLAHAMESLLSRLAEGAVEPETGRLEQLRAGFDALAAMLDDLRTGRPLGRESERVARLEAASRGEAGPSPAEPAGEPTEKAPVEGVLEAFLEEGEEILERLDRAVDQWRHDESTAPLQAAQRELHTLKGGARTADVAPLADLAHSLESALEAVAGGRLEVSEELADTVQATVDALHDMLGSASEGGSPSVPEGLIERLESTTRPAAAAKSAEAEVAAGPAEQRRTAAGRARKALGSSGLGEVVRIPASRLESMINFAGETTTYHSRLHQQLHDFSGQLEELERTVGRLSRQLRDLEFEAEAQMFHGKGPEGRDAASFDPLEMDRYTQVQELSRAIAESMSDVQSLHEALDESVQDTETLLEQQERVSRDLQQELMSTRMVSFSTLVSRLQRIVRQAARSEGKQAELVLEGEYVELDRHVLDGMVAPLEHMLRNAVAHGIEKPDERAAAGKDPAGRITLSLSNQGNDVVIDLRDDGRGINTDAVRRKAEKAGLIKPGEAVSADEAANLILASGLSTAEQVSQVAGRGVGMDVVAQAVKELGGRLGVGSQPGAGTHFSLVLPSSLSITQGILANVGDESYLIPYGALEGVARVSSEELRRLFESDNPYFEYGGERYALQYLGGLLDVGEPQFAQATMRPVFMVRAGERRMAVYADDLEGSREIFIKPLGPQLNAVRGVAGATLLGDGRVVLVLDVNDLLRPGQTTVSGQQIEERVAAREESRRPVVMVVDDSITMRKVATRLLERHDMEAATAKDGVDAIGRLQEIHPDVMILDIEMPRMDGYELAQHIRNEPGLRDIPIIMVTSRTGEKHRQRALDMGVDAYLGKPYSESVLLETVDGLLQGRGSTGKRAEEG